MSLMISLACCVDTAENDLLRLSEARAHALDQRVEQELASLPAMSTVT